MTVGLAIGLLAAASYALRAGGLFLPSDNQHVKRFATPLTAAILASLVVTSSLSSGNTLTLDARAVGLVVAVIAAARRLPLLATLLLAVAATALARHLM